MVRENEREWLEACWREPWKGNSYCVETEAERVLEKNFKRTFALPTAKSHARWLQDKRSAVRP